MIIIITFQVGKCRFDESKAVTKINALVKIQEKNDEHLKAAVAIIGPISIIIHVSGSFGPYEDGMNIYF